jgi:hypothetical protein
MSELLLGLVVLAAIGGSVLNTVRGWKRSEPKESYDISKGITAIIPAIFVGITIGQNVFTALPDGIGFLLAILTALSAGFAIDVAVSEGKK